MSSSEASNDEYDYEKYGIEWFEEDDGPPLIAKRARLLACAVQNDLETLKELLDAPKWYKVRDAYGLNLLQIAILRENKAVFDYLLTLEDFPLEAVDDQGSTALMVSLNYFVSNDIYMGDHYAYELIKKGADIRKRCPDGNSLLHCALDRGFVRVARLLIEAGADVNAQNAEGRTPLYMCVFCDEDDINEAVTMLLCNGADPTKGHSEDNTPFLEILGYHEKTFLARENLFYFTVDQWTSYKISAEELLRIVRFNCPLMKQVIDKISEVTFNNNETIFCFRLFELDCELLLILLRKFSHVVKEILSNYSDNSFKHTDFNLVYIENFNFLIDSPLRSEMIEFITNLNSSLLLTNLIDCGKSECEMTELILYLLSYGMCMCEIDFQTIYRKFGYCELFKILLCMDVKKNVNEPLTDAMPRLICDVATDIQLYIANPHLCTLTDLEVLFDYYAHPKLQDRYCFVKNKEMTEKRKQLPQIPLLVELARNEFRRYFIKRFKITSAKMFYTLIKFLPISSKHEKIITFETKLY